MYNLVFYICVRLSTFFLDVATNFILSEIIIIIMIIVHVVQKKERKKVLSTSNSVNHELNIRPSKLNIRES